MHFQVFFFFKVCFGEHTLQVQAKTNFCHETQVHCLRKMLNQYTEEDAGGNRRAATQESHVCGDSCHKTWSEWQSTYCQSASALPKKHYRICCIGFFWKRNDLSPVPSGVSAACLPSCISLSWCFQVMCLSDGTPHDAIMYQPCQKTMHRRWPVGLTYNLPSFTYLSLHPILYHQHVVL